MARETVVANYIESVLPFHVLVGLFKGYVMHLEVMLQLITIRLVCRVELKFFSLV